MLSLKDAVTSGRFTISLSTGHKHTLYVFSDPMCPHCRALEPRLQELSKRYNVEIFPVSVYGDLRSMVRAAPVLDTGKDTRLKSWEDTINMGYTTMNPKLTIRKQPRIPPAPAWLTRTIWHLRNSGLSAPRPSLPIRVM